MFICFCSKVLQLLIPLYLYQGIQNHIAAYNDIYCCGVLEDLCLKTDIFVPLRIQLSHFCKFSFKKETISFIDHIFEFIAFKDFLRISNQLVDFKLTLIDTKETKI
ncbi:hypothetical protein H312_03124 [Anncaliia algerae PRA339]|uniref:Uncharacterized protein n=1 Tax=Anncaliia algerae PRA339 TaxID=1288291 RepID=A0A059EWT0_9MICR|nr:hypothetical protein H312_03124 [Anncaliia algerae PRA339]